MTTSLLLVFLESSSCELDLSSERFDMPITVEKQTNKQTKSQVAEEMGQGKAALGLRHILDISRNMLFPCWRQVTDSVKRFQTLWDSGRIHDAHKINEETFFLCWGLKEIHSKGWRVGCEISLLR